MRTRTVRRQNGRCLVRKPRIDAMALHALRWALLVAALAPSAYYLIAIYCVWDYFRKVRHAPQSAPDFTPPVSVLKPVRGVDRDAYENFASFCRQNYPRFEILFAVADRGAPVIPLIVRWQRDFPPPSLPLTSPV